MKSKNLRFVEWRTGNSNSYICHNARWIIHSKQFLENHYLLSEKEVFHKLSVAFKKNTRNSVMGKAKFARVHKVEIILLNFTTYCTLNWCSVHGLLSRCLRINFRELYKYFQPRQRSLNPTFDLFLPTLIFEKIQVQDISFLSQKDVHSLTKHLL